MNTKMIYMYTDGGNYKYRDNIIVKGKITASQIKEIENSLTEDGFIPEQIDIPILRPIPENEDDHCWHTLEDFTFTEEEPTEDIAVEELVERFKKAAKDGWDEFAIIIDDEEDNEEDIEDKKDANEDTNVTKKSIPSMPREDMAIIIEAYRGYVRLNNWFEELFGRNYQTPQLYGLNSMQGLDDLLNIADKYSRLPDEDDGPGNPMKMDLIIPIMENLDLSVNEVIELLKLNVY